MTNETLTASLVTASTGQIFVILLTALGALGGLSCLAKACYHSYHPQENHALKNLVRSRTNCTSLDLGGHAT